MKPKQFPSRMLYFMKVDKLEKKNAEMNNNEKTGVYNVRTTISI